MTVYRFLFLLLLLGSTAIAQVKYEKEERIQKEALPTAVSKLLPLMETHVKRMRYYREFDGQSSSYEIKFKKHDTHISVEFSQEGVLEDVEVLVAKSALPTAVLEAVKAHFQRVKFNRIQKQFVHPQGAIPTHTLQAVFENQLVPTAYELEVSGKTQNGYQQFELLIDPAGKLLKKSSIITKDYEHVVY